MRRRIFYRTLLGAQFLLFLLAIGSGLYLLWLTTTPDVRADRDAAEAIHGLRLGASLFIGSSLIWLASFIGILKMQAWGWWLGLVINSFIFAASTYDFVSDSYFDGEDLVGPVIFLILTVLHLLSRPTSWKAAAIEAQKVSETQQSAGSGI